MRLPVHSSQWLAALACALLACPALGVTAQNIPVGDGPPIGEMMPYDPSQDPNAGPRCLDLGIPNPLDDFIAQKWNCEQRLIADMNDRFSLYDEWLGFGIDWACDTQTFQNIPIGRTYNALQVLLSAGQTQPVCERRAQSSMLEWAYCYVGESISLVPVCAYTDSYAFTRFPLSNETELYVHFFFDQSPVQRASTLVHEARHAEGTCQHIDDDGCLDGISCDESFGDGCTGFLSKGGRGANGFEVSYLQAFLRDARSDFLFLPGDSEDSIRRNAMDTANYVLGRRFKFDPCFRIDIDGNEIGVCSAAAPEPEPRDCGFAPSCEELPPAL